MSERITIRRDAVSWTPTDDGQVVILDLRTSRYLSLNASAARLWTLLSDGAQRGDLAAELTTAYGLAGDAAARDVDAFLDGLHERDFVEFSSV